MSTIVFVHAHPDDEASSTAGSMARASDEGHRVVLVIATNGDHGTAPADLAGRTVAEHRREEVGDSAKVLQIAVHRDYIHAQLQAGVTQATIHQRLVREHGLVRAAAPAAPVESRGSFSSGSPRTSCGPP